MTDDRAVPRLTEAHFVAAAARSEEDRYRRRASKTSRIKALAQLNEILVEDGRLFASADLQDKRDAVAHALMAVVKYLNDQGISPFATAPLLRPVIALSERENNSIDLMFAQRARGGRPKTELRQYERSGILAALAEGWLLTHKADDRPQKAKLQDAARRMKGRWFGTITRAQLETARELVSQEANDHPVVNSARTAYALFVETAELFGANEAFGIMVRLLNDMKLPIGAGEGGISKTPPISSTGEG